MVIGQAEASMEIRVRALMALAMLLGGSSSNQRRLASMPAAVHGLTLLMRQTDDEDARQVSSTVFAELVRPRLFVSLTGHDQEREGDRA